MHIFNLKYTWCYLIFGLLIFVASCKGSKNILTNTAELKKVKKAADIVRLANANVIDPVDFEGEGLLRFKRENLDMTFQTIVRVKKDSAIWMVLKKLGFEVARLRINADSIHLIDRYHQEVSMASNNDLIRLLGLNTVYPAGEALPVLQDMLVGRVLDLDASAALHRQDSTIRLKGQLQSSMYEYLFDKKAVPEKLFIDAPKFSIHFVETFNKYQYVKDSLSVFSFDRMFDIKEKDLNTKIEIQFKNITINEPKNMPFSVPSRYRRKALF